MSADERLPAHLEVAGLIRSVQAAGGFATVVAKGEREAGSLLVLCCENGRDYKAFERMPSAEGGRQWHLVRKEVSEQPFEFEEYLQRRRKQDNDLWIVELDIANAPRFVGIDPSQS